MMQGQIIEGRGGLYTVRDAAGIDHVLRAKKKFRRQHMIPLVGDGWILPPARAMSMAGWRKSCLAAASACARGGPILRCW